MSRYCLDTPAYSRLRRGNERIAHLLDAAIWVGVPTVTLGELRFGFLGGAHRTRNETELSDFLGAPPVEVVPVDDAVARCYAEIVADLKRGDPGRLREPRGVGGPGLGDLGRGDAGRAVMVPQVRHICLTYEAVEKAS